MGNYVFSAKLNWLAVTDITCTSRIYHRSWSGRSLTVLTTFAVSSRLANCLRSPVSFYFIWFLFLWFFVAVASCSRLRFERTLNTWSSLLQPHVITILGHFDPIVNTEPGPSNCHCRYRLNSQLQKTPQTCIVVDYAQYGFTNCNTYWFRHYINCLLAYFHNYLRTPLLIYFLNNSPFRFQAGGRKRRPTLVSVFVCVCVIVYLVTDSCLLLLC